MFRLASAVCVLAASRASFIDNSWCEGSDCNDNISNVNLLQVQADFEQAKRSTKDDFRCAPIAKIWDEDERYQQEGVCGDMHYKPIPRDLLKYYPGSPLEKDLERPLLEIRQEHGTEDLFYHFSLLNDWINPGSAYDPDNNYESLKSGMITSQGSKYKSPVDMTFKWDGNEIHTRQDQMCQTGDDPYCFANGWMKNQNPALNPATLDNYTEFLSFAQDQCHQMNEQYHFDQDNITMLSHTRETNAMYVMSDNACNLMPTNGQLPTNRDFKKHSYVKCLMNNALSEIAYCYFRGCALEGNRIGHGDECDY